jgi:NAD(P)-dependent dehydrogenase (short-subunit alcohol dehydrogenase family)
MSYTTTTHRETYPALTAQRLPPNRTVLITGAGSGIGRATALSHARLGAASLILLGRRADTLAETASQIKAAHPSVDVAVHAVDILSLPSLTEIFSSRKIDTVIHCAGALLPLRPVADQDQAELWAVFETNARGALNVALAYAKSIPEEGGKGVILGLNSAGVFMPFKGGLPGMGGYAAAKLAAVKLLDSVAADTCAGGKRDLRVTHVHPGLLKTDMAERFEEIGISFPYDDMTLPADFLVWAGSEEADFLADRFVHASWDVEELKAKREKIQGGSDLTIGLLGV